MFDQLLSNLQMAFWIALALGGVIALAALVYIVRVASLPLVRVAQWLVAYKPGEEPSELVAGIAVGARMLAWAGVVGVIVWFLFH